MGLDALELAVALTHLTVTLKEASTTFSLRAVNQTTPFMLQIVLHTSEVLK